MHHKTIATLLAALLLMLSACAPNDEEPEETAAQAEEGAANIDEDDSDEADDAADDEAESAEEVEEDAGDDEEPGASRDTPVPLGDSASIAGWDVRVVDTTTDATDEVLAENEFNEPPEEGRQFFFARIEATFTGEDVEENSGHFWIDVTTNVVDDNNVTYDSMDDYCGVIPDALEDTSEVFEGGTVEGNLCWPVESEAVDSLVMFAEVMFSFDDTRTWFALD